MKSAGMRRTPKASPVSLRARFSLQRLECGVFRRFRLLCFPALRFASLAGYLDFALPVCHVGPPSATLRSTNTYESFEPPVEIADGPGRFAIARRLGRT